jgi:hypothetical protein
MDSPSLLSARDDSRGIAAGRFQLAGVLLLGLLLLAGVIYSVLLPPVARFTDEQEYLKLSANLLHGPGFSLDGVHLTAARPPGYAFFLAAVRLLGGEFVLARVVQFFLLGGTIYLVARLGSNGGKNLAGVLLVTLLVICYPVLFYTCATLYPQTLAGFLFIAALSCLLATPGGWTADLAAGVLFGFLILVAPTFLLTMAVVLAMAWIFRLIRWPKAALVFLFAMLIVSTWTMRNAVCLNHFVPVATNSGLNFLEGNNPNATAEAAANVGMEPYYEKAGKLQLNEFQRDRFYREAAFAWIEAHPADALLLYFEKVANFFNVRNAYSSESQAEVAPWKQIVLAAGYLLLLGLLAWRLAGWRKFPLTPRDKLFLAVYILSAFTSAIFFTRIRHRLPYDYLIIAVIASNLSARLEAWLRPGRSIDSQ